MVRRQRSRLLVQETSRQRRGVAPAEACGHSRVARPAMAGHAIGEANRPALPEGIVAVPDVAHDVREDMPVGRHVGLVPLGVPLVGVDAAEAHDGGLQGREGDAAVVVGEVHPMLDAVVAAPAPGQDVAVPSHHGVRQFHAGDDLAGNSEGESEVDLLLACRRLLVHPILELDALQAPIKHHAAAERGRSQPSARC